MTAQHNGPSLSFVWLEVLTAAAAGQYTMEDLALGGFTLSAAEMHTLSAM